MSVCQSVGRSEITFFYRFFHNFELFWGTEVFLSTFLRLLNISETSVHFWDFRTFLRLPYISETSVYIWVFCIFYEILFREHATYGCFPWCFNSLFLNIYNSYCLSGYWILPVKGKKILVYFLSFFLLFHFFHQFVSLLFSCFFARFFLSLQSFFPVLLYPSPSRALLGARAPHLRWGCIPLTTGLAPCPTLLCRDEEVVIFNQGF